ncbi:carboxylate-amine ligase [uncultured Enterovirga sp.]|uniref:carboxylate-amine ligase n=1 Tax=uncultured Enterovirga sp. TaxID=2026352 RepID=UPI0035CBED50
MNGSFQFGIEEEFFLADAITRGTPGRSLDAFHAAVHRDLPEAERELLQSQVEIASPPTTSFAEARLVLSSMREQLSAVGREHGIRLLASGTHPMAHWSEQEKTEKARYRALTEEMQMLGRRNVVCGMHVHVEVPDPDRRVDLMNRLLPYTPLLLALSSSSPFWQGRPTGLAAYRLSVWGEMPRTGLPELFRDAHEYERLVATMVSAGAIKDASFLWWTLRPSIRYPTLELRVADSCTKLEDTLAVAALYRCLVRWVVREPTLNAGLTGASRAIVSENLWRAQRDGVRASFIDEASGTSVACSEYLTALLDQLEPDATELGCTAELDRSREIVAHGTSSDRQLAILEQAAGSDDASSASVSAVVDWIADTTAPVALGR